MQDNDLKTTILLDNHIGFTGLLRVIEFFAKIKCIEQDMTTMNQGGMAILEVVDVVVISEATKMNQMEIFVVIVNQFFQRYYL